MAHAKQILLIIATAGSSKATCDLRLVRRGERLAKIICTTKQVTIIFLHFKIAINNSYQLFFSHFSFIFTQHIVQNLVLFRRSLFFESQTNI
jgi:hypothetical protein